MGIDTEGDFPYDAVQKWAKAHGRAQELDAMGADIENKMLARSEMLAKQGISGELRMLNDPAAIAASQDFYRRMVSFGSGDDQPGVALLTAWYKRNFILCARLAQQVQPGDRVIVIFGAGHAFQLRQCVTEMPGWNLVEPNEFLPH